MNPTRFHLVPVLAFAAVLFLTTVTADACPSCKEAVAGSDGQVAAQTSELGRGFSYSVLFMMAMPFVLVGGFGTVCYLHMRNRPTA